MRKWHWSSRIIRNTFSCHCAHLFLWHFWSDACLWNLTFFLICNHYELINLTIFTVSHLLPVKNPSGRNENVILDSDLSTYFSVRTSTLSVMTISSGCSLIPQLCKYPQPRCVFGIFWKICNFLLTFKVLHVFTDSVGRLPLSSAQCLACFLTNQSPIGPYRHMPCQCLNKNCALLYIQARVCCMESHEMH